ncbi:MAG: flagellar hook-associated protein FlgK [Phycisphaerae bacterium]|nr:flagellar hook-associated protein FlgK [Phycisphaerae bacterium]
MSGFDIGLTGLEAARRAIDLIGSNIANASTEGYHKQEMITAPLHVGGKGGAAGGVKVVDTRRAIDTLIEREYILQQPLLGQSAQELSTLKLLENAMGDIDTQGLMLSIEGYFNAMRELAAQPNSPALRYQAVWAADGLSDQFRHVGTFVADLENAVAIEAKGLMREANALIEEIARLNGQARELIAQNKGANAIRDMRDQAIAELGELVDIQVTGLSDPGGAIGLSVWGTPVVVGSNAMLLDAELIGSTGDLGISARGASFYQTEVRGGRIGGLLALRNELLPNVSDSLDALAQEIVTRTNQYHVQGLGEAGSFTDITGRPASTEALSAWDGWGTDVTAGTINLRVTNKITDAVTLHQIAVDGTSTLVSVAADLDALAEINAEVADYALHIESANATQYGFDFLPVPVLDTTTNPWTASVQPELGGTYTGDTNEIYTFTVLGPGAPGSSAEIGVDQGLSVEVRNGANELVRTVTVGLGYAAGDTLDVGRGLKLAFQDGSLTIGEKFEVSATALSDTSGILAAAGVNTLFFGTTATTIGVRTEILDDPRLLATSLSVTGDDNANVTRIADLVDTSLQQLGYVTPTDYFRQLITGLGQDITFRQLRYDSLESAMAQLESERERISGVDINEEAAKMVMYEKMFQGMAKFLSIQNELLNSLMDLL